MIRDSVTVSASGAGRGSTTSAAASPVVDKRSPESDARSRIPRTLEPASPSMACSRRVEVRAAGAGHEPDDRQHFISTVRRDEPDRRATAGRQRASGPGRVRTSRRLTRDWPSRPPPGHPTRPATRPGLRAPIATAPMRPRSPPASRSRWSPALVPGAARGSRDRGCERGEGRRRVRPRRPGESGSPRQANSWPATTTPRLRSEAEPIAVVSDDARGHEGRSNATMFLATRPSGLPR